MVDAPGSGCPPCAVGRGRGGAAAVPAQGDPFAVSVAWAQQGDLVPAATAQSLIPAISWAQLAPPKTWLAGIVPGQ